MAVDLSNARIAVIGLGYVGLPLAIEFAKRRPVVGFDVKPERIAELKSGHDFTLEVSSQDLADACQLALTSEIEDLRSCQVFIVTVPTPVDNAKRPDLTPLVRASENVGKVLSEGSVV